MPKFVPRKEYSLDDITLVRKINAKKQYDSKRVGIILSDQAYDYFKVGNGFEFKGEKKVRIKGKGRQYTTIKTTSYRYRIYWGQYFLPPDFYIDRRPKEIKLQHRMFEVDYFKDNPRSHKTMIVLNDVQKTHLGDLCLKLDLYNEPYVFRKDEIAFAHLASIVLEAIASGDLELRND